MRRPKRKPVDMHRACVYCGASFLARVHSMFCSKRCAMSHRWADSNFRSKAIAAMIAAPRPRSSTASRLRWRDPTYRARVVSGVTNYHRNRPKEVQERMLAAQQTPNIRKFRSAMMTDTWARRTRTQKNAVLKNLIGRPSPEQILLGRVLPKEWVMEHCISRKRYRVDWANVERRIAIEVDGENHNETAVRKEDALKERALKRLGWTVFRITNAEVRKMFGKAS